MSKGLTKAERIREMERLYIQRPYSDIEMAERLGVDRTTVYRDRMEMEVEYPFVQDDQGRYKIDKERYISGIRLNLHEALALYLAARRTARSAQGALPHVGSALEKLAVALKQPMTERLVRAAGNLLEGEQLVDRAQVMEALARGWSEYFKVRIRHQGLHQDKLREYLVSPYLIEPSIWSDGVYLIGESQEHGGIATFKVERIQEAWLTAQSFELPKDFDEQELLRYAWGIWYADQKPALVRLRFREGAAARRLRESKWHPTQEIEELPDGGCIWQAQVAEVREMLPWVRGWGADCEVLEPSELRRWVEEEVNKSAELYGISLSNNSNEFYAHFNNFSKLHWQKLSDHLKNTAELARKFGKDAGVSEFAYLVGIMHDLGKYSKEFQKRLEGIGPKVDHSTAGAKEIVSHFNDNPNEKFIAKLLAYCIAGHHTGLPDYGSLIDLDSDGTLCARIKKEVPDYSAYKNDLTLSNYSIISKLPIKPIKGNEGFSLALFTRMVYSALVDADFQDTESFMAGKEKSRGEFEDIESLHNMMIRYLNRFRNPNNEINRMRNITLKECLSMAKEKPGLFTLTVPTGGGKTIASMAFAIEHAITHKKKRIIYVIPFTTIIEQNASVFKDILGEENVLEHHCNFDWQKDIKVSINKLESEEGYNALEKLKIGSENWDVPIVVTTNVQFFESLFSNRSSKCRKLHNIANSVIIFDEAQMLPKNYMKPCIESIHELVRNYQCTAVFCTATQPALGQFFPPDTKITEISSDPKLLYDFYRRVKVDHIGKLSDDQLLSAINEKDQVLCIVNTRRHAKGMFEGLKKEGRFHLSTLMCPQHRKSVVQKIKERLSKGQICRVISTQIMEAGIDIDFSVGYRSIAGIESIIQAAGRINREGKKDIGKLYVFEADTEFIKRMPTFVKQQSVFSQTIFENYQDPISLEAIQEYFEDLYHAQSEHEFDNKGILNYFNKGVDEPNFDFHTAAKNFRLIEENTVAIIIPYDNEAERLIDQLTISRFPASIAKKLQKYAVNIYESELYALENKGVIDVYCEKYFVLNQEKFYDAESGLKLVENSHGEAIIFDQ